MDLGFEAEGLGSRVQVQKFKGSRVTGLELGLGSRGLGFRDGLRVRGFKDLGCRVGFKGSRL